jgi:hypothetical protein
MLFPFALLLCPLFEQTLLFVNNKSIAPRHDRSLIRGLEKFQSLSNWKLTGPAALTEPETGRKRKTTSALRALVVFSWSRKSVKSAQFAKSRLIPDSRH